MKGLFGLAGILIVLSSTTFSQSINLFFNSTPQVDFAVSDLEKSAGRNNLLVKPLSSYRQGNAGPTIVLAQLKDSAAVGTVLKGDESSLKGLESEGFSIIVSSTDRHKSIYVIGFDEPGLMYGTLELSEQMRFGGLDGIAETSQNPYMKTRGVKFNIPLDVRTPSYSDASDAAQKNIATVWDFGFWKAFIDHLAKDRYNLISLWNLHPFPSMVKVPEYPDVALNDVQRTKAPWKEYNPTNGRLFSTPDKLANVEVLKEITIVEKIAFWRKVMKYGKERNVSFYIITWNVFVNGAAGKYGITDNYENPVTKDYTRKSVRQMILTYPELAGIAFTTGESFIKAKSVGREDPLNNTFDGKHVKADSKEKEAWCFETYGQGILDALKEQPGRKFTLIHRMHQARMEDVTSSFKPVIDNVNINFIYSFKYGMDHALSSTIQPFGNNFVQYLRSEGKFKTIWTIRNDDSFYFRWGAPDFVREFIKNIPYDVSDGIYYGSDGWVWGREFLSKDPQNANQLEVGKHWYDWMLWGRLGYNPGLKNETIVKMLATKFPGASAAKLFDAWQNASMIYPTTTGLHWGGDFQWYIEGCKRYPRPAEGGSGFKDVNTFIFTRPHPGTNFQSIPEYVNMIKSDSTSNKVSPLQVAQSIIDYSTKALAGIEGISAGEDKDFFYTISDIKAMAYLGMYYGHKIKGATELQKYRILDGGKERNQKAAVDELTEAGKCWRMYADLAGKYYKNPVWTNRVGTVDWEEAYKGALKDIHIAKAAN